MIRLDKYLSDMGYGSRSETKKYIKSGMITINQKPEKDAGRKVDPLKDSVYYLDQKVIYEEYQYLLLNKPAGVVSATRDSVHQTVLDLCAGPGIRSDLVPVGRLDLDTEGLLLMTNDGALNHNLLAPGKHVDKEYIARLRDALDQEQQKTYVEAFFQGLEVLESEKGNDAFTSKPAKLRFISNDTANVTLTEGKYHQVKRMFAALGNEVVYLKRIRMGTLALDETVDCGSYRRLTEQERKDLLS